MSETVKAAIYTRVSTEEQAHPDKTSLAQQREKAEAYCKAQSWDVAAVYEDAGVSGAKSDRPALTRMMADSQEGKFQRVIFLKLDRLGRSLRDLLNISHRLDKLDVGIVSLHDSFDTGTSSGRLFFSILGAVSEFERELITERMQAGKLGAARKGAYVGGPSPFGYDYDPHGKTLVVNDDEAAVVKRIFRLYIAEGLSHDTIARRLNDEGVPTKTERVRSLDGEKKGWVRTQVARILTNPLYTGQAYYNRSSRKGGEKPEAEWVTMRVPAIVSEEEFSAGKQRAKRNKRESQRPRDEASLYLLSGLIRCQECGRAMMAATRRHRSKKRLYLYRYYVCTGQNTYRTPCRPTKTVKADAIEDAVLTLLAETFSDPDKVLEALHLHTQEKEAKREDEDALEATLARNLANIEGEQDLIITLFGKEKITEAQFDKKMEAVRREEQKWRDDLAAIKERQQQNVVVQDVAANAHTIAELVRGILGEMPLEKKKELVRWLVEGVWVDRRNEVRVDCVVREFIPDRRSVHTNAF